MAPVIVKELKARYGSRSRSKTFWEGLENDGQLGDGWSKVVQINDQQWNTGDYGALV